MCIVSKNLSLVPQNKQVLLDNSKPEVIKIRYLNSNLKVTDEVEITAYELKEIVEFVRTFSNWKI